MQLDYDLIRELLTNIEQVTPQEEFYTDDERKCYHLKQMISAGLIEGWSRRDSIMGGWGAEITDLTMKGHEFLSACRKSKVWEAIKKACAEKGVALALDLIVALAKQTTLRLMNME